MCWLRKTVNSFPACPTGLGVSALLRKQQILLTGEDSAQYAFPFLVFTLYCTLWLAVLGMELQNLAHGRQLCSVTEFELYPDLFSFFFFFKAFVTQAGSGLLR